MMSSSSEPGFKGFPSLEIWRDIETLLGSDCDYQSNGSLRIAESDADVEILEKRVAGLAVLGYSHEELIVDVQTDLPIVPFAVERFARAEPSLM